MARYESGHKEATRHRLMDAAGRRFKRDGIDGAGIATLVADAGLTNGAFYGHFRSKDDLVANVITAQLSAQQERVAAIPAGPAGVEAFVREYLSPEHRDDPENGCPSAALLDELGRCDEETRHAYTAGVRSFLDVIARLLDSIDTQDSYDRATGLFTLLVSTLQLARAVTDPALSDRVLAAGVANALALAHVPGPSAGPAIEGENR